jgi:hypothetical protein
MTSPGGGAGNEAATDAMIAAVMPTLFKALQAYQLGSKKQQAVLNAVRALTPTFGRAEAQAMAAPAIQQMAMNQKPGGPMANAPMPPIAAAPPPGAKPGGMPGGGPEDLAA